ncbi:MAG: ice-binding family protein [Candidatus Thermoplasmatota archaeon]
MRRTLALVPALLVLSALLGGCTGPAGPPPDLGAAGSFAVLAGSGITNTGTTSITGDVGSHPTPAQTGFETVTLVGMNHHDDVTTQQAKVDLAAAYEDARDRTGSAPVGDLGGQTLVPGVYRDDDAPDSMAITGTVTLDGLGDPGSVFIFQSGSTLVTASASAVVLTNGTQACNVFWQITSSATLGTDSQFAGTILALTDITLDTGATVTGRILARNGAVTLDNNTIVHTSCLSSTTSSAPTSTSPSVPVFPTQLVAILAGTGAIVASAFVWRQRK